MISLVSVPLENVKRAVWRDSWSAFDTPKPLAVDHIFTRLVEHVRLGATLPIHAALIQGEYSVLDGHLALDVYEHMGRKEVTLIVHDDVTSIVAARAKYVSMNYLRSTEWLRDGVKLQKTLTDVGYTTASHCMEDPDLAKDLIERNVEQWDKFSKEVLLRDHEGGDVDADQQSAF